MSQLLSHLAALVGGSQLCVDSIHGMCMRVFKIPLNVILVLFGVVCLWRKRHSDLRIHFVN